MNFWIRLRELWPIRFLYEKRTAEIILDKTAFRNSESKIISVWRWSKMKRVKFLVHYNKEKGKFIIRELK